MYINTVNSYLKNIYGCKVYKLALDGGFTCPNRDGKLDTRGCIFCSGAGSGDFSIESSSDVNEAIEKAKQVVASKVKDDCKYIAYFQSYTNTYGSLDKMKLLFETAINNPDIEILSVATRPDCVGDEVIDLLKNLNEIKPVWVELGLQSVHEKTAEYIRRGYTLPVFDDAVERLKKAGLNVIVHMIIGLPYETDDEIYQTAEYIGQSGADGVKFQLLHVLKGTDLAKEYEVGKFKELTLDKYVGLLEGCVRRVPKDMVIHRLTGDGAKKNLIAPLWSANKKNVINTINKRFEQDNVIQGEIIE